MTIALAGCIILDFKGRLLLIHRQTKDYDHWEIPGGKVELSETSNQTAKRELLEELAIEVHSERKLGEANFMDKARQFHYVWWLATTTDTPRIAEQHLFTEWRYFEMSTLDSNDISLSEGAKAFIALVKSGKVRL